MRTVLILFIVLRASFTTGQQPTPSAKDIFKKMKETIAKAKTINYTSQYKSVNSAIDDSLFVASANVWAKIVPSDTIFGAYFHVEQEGMGTKSDYYYDGLNGIDVIHEHKKPELAKMVTIVEPLLLGNGYNTVQSRTSVRPYFEELGSIKAINKWMTMIDSTTVKEDASKQYWILEWPENNLKENFFATRQVYVDKQSGLPHEMHRRTKWNGTRYDTDVYLKNIKVDNANDEAFAALKETYPDYKVTYSKRKSAPNEAAVPALIGTKATPFSYASFTGETVSLKEQKSKLVLLDFWESWCGYCFVAMPKLKALYERYSSKGLEIVGVVTENKSKVEAILENQQFPYKTIYAKTNILRDYNVHGRPTYVLIDDKGTIVDYAAGDFGKIEKAVEKYLQ